jgi:hypothetical protein
MIDVTVEDDEDGERVVEFAKVSRVTTDPVVHSLSGGTCDE